MDNGGESGEEIVDPRPSSVVLAKAPKSGCRPLPSEFKKSRSDCCAKFNLSLLSSAIGESTKD